MSQALNKTGRPIFYSMCNWGDDSPFDWAYTIANSYRMSGDIYDSFNRPDSRCPCDEAIGCSWPGFHCSVMNILNKVRKRSHPTLFLHLIVLVDGRNSIPHNVRWFRRHGHVWNILS
jgi:hypothetical protein